MKIWWQRLWWILPLVIIASASVTAWAILKQPTKIVTCDGAYAQQFVCWQQRYNQMVKQQSPEAAMADFKNAYSSIPYVKGNCHQIAHVIGRAAAERYSTLMETYSHGDNFCWSGYYHGAIETIAAKIGRDKIVAQLNDVCAGYLKSKPYSFDHYNCVHGMGHGVMAIEDDNLFKALNLCDKYDGEWQQQSCYGGVFMENVMNEINPGEHSSYLKADEALYPCTAVEDHYKEQCYLMQTSHALIVEKYDYSKVFADCATVASPYDQTCYQSLGRDVSGQSSSNQAQTVQLCMLGPTQTARENCFTGAVKDFISYYHNDKQGLFMCAAIPDKELAASCTTQAQEYYKTF